MKKINNKNLKNYKYYENRTRKIDKKEFKGNQTRKINKKNLKNYKKLI